jgi:hypothetical protein
MNAPVAPSTGWLVLRLPTRRDLVLTGPLVFLDVNLQHNCSEFLATLRVFVRRDGEHYIIEVGAAVANAITYLCELFDPISILLTLTSKNLSSSFAFTLFSIFQPFAFGELS